MEFVQVRKQALDELLAAKIERENFLKAQKLAKGKCLKKKKSSQPVIELDSDTDENEFDSSVKDELCTSEKKRFDSSVKDEHCTPEKKRVGERMRNSVKPFCSQGEFILSVLNITTLSDSKPNCSREKNTNQGEVTVQDCLR